MSGPRHSSTAGVSSAGVVSTFFVGFELQEAGWLTSLHKSMLQDLAMPG